MSSPMLLSMPPEIRNMIYDFCLNEHDQRDPINLRHAQPPSSSLLLS